MACWTAGVVAFSLAIGQTLQGTSFSVIPWRKNQRNATFLSTVWSLNVFRFSSTSSPCSRIIVLTALPQLDHLTLHHLLPLQHPHSLRLFTAKDYFRTLTMKLKKCTISVQTNVIYIFNLEKKQWFRIFYITRLLLILRGTRSTQKLIDLNNLSRKMTPPWAARPTKYRQEYPTLPAVQASKPPSIWAVQ